MYSNSTKSEVLLACIKIETKRSVHAKRNVEEDDESKPCDNVNTVKHALQGQNTNTILDDRDTDTSC